MSYLIADSSYNDRALIVRCIEGDLYNYVIKHMLIRDEHNPLIGAIPMSILKRMHSMVNCLMEIYRPCTVSYFGDDIIVGCPVCYGTELIHNMRWNYRKCRDCGATYTKCRL